MYIGGYILALSIEGVDYVIVVFIDEKEDNDDTLHNQFEGK